MVRTSVGKRGQQRITHVGAQVVEYSSDDSQVCCSVVPPSHKGALPGHVHAPEGDESPALRPEVHCAEEKVLAVLVGLA